MMDNPENSASVVDTGKAEKEEEAECTVCRGPIISPTALSDCVHEFCYDCIVQWLIKGSDSSNETGEQISIEQILAQKEPEAVAAEDLITEKRIVSKKMRSCRRMMSRIDELLSAQTHSSQMKKRQVASKS
ncbi:unnamed protein product [Caenorhabditis sp. 36 PRJEB53466]|nr:unnamed protein product [Caenorhabditis sp. 36 PRJEB53466]